MRVLSIFYFVFLWANLFEIKAEEPVHSEYSYRRYTTQDGLPQMLVECIYLDSSGHLWVGTLSGFAKYDGLNFKTYLNGREENIIRIKENEQQELQAFAYRRAYTVDTYADTLRVDTLTRGEKFMNQYNSRILPAGYAIYDDGMDAEKALYKITPDGLECIFDHQALDLLGEFGRLYWDQAEKIFFIPGDNEVHIISEDTTSHEVLTDLSIRTFVVYQEELWGIAVDGLYRYKERSFHKVYDYSFEFCNNGLTGCVNRENQLIIKDEKNLYRFDGRQMTVIYKGMNLIRDILIDGEGNLWVATYQGLYNFFRLHFRNYYLPDKEDMVRALVADDRDNIYAGTLHGRLYVHKGDHFSAVSYPDNPMLPLQYRSEKSFQPFPVSRNGTVWFPYYGGVLTKKGDKFAWMDLPLNNYNFAVPAPKDGVLIGTRSEQWIYNKDKQLLYSVNRNMHRQMAHCAGFDHSGRLWIGGSNGMSVMEADSVFHLPDPDIRICSAIQSAPDGTIWFAAENRLYKTAGESPELVCAYPNLIRNLLVTSTGYIIVATLDGIHILDRESMASVFYNKSNGYTGIEPLKAYMAEDGSGNVWLASIAHFTCFNPRSMMYEQTSPRLQIVSIAASGRNAAWETYKGNSVKLDHKKHNLQFRYIGLSYSAAGNVRYQYRLKGVQEEWSEPTSETEITFNNIRPGKYEFQLKANAGTAGTETGVLTIPVYLTPAIWQTWWFILLSCITAIGILSRLIYRYVQQRNLQQMRTLAREIQLNDLRIKSIRLKSIPHFNSNVLAGIEYYMMNYSKEEANIYLSMYSQFTNQTLQDVDKACRTLHSEIEYVCLYLSLEKLRFGEKVNHEIEADEEVNQQIQVPNMVLHTYCENAVKHGLRNKPGTGKINIKIGKQEGGIQISVEDDGVGRDAAAQARGHSTKQGLAILMQQIELYNQRNENKIVQQVVDLKDQDGRACGTRFELYIPEHFNYY